MSNYQFKELVDVKVLQQISMNIYKIAGMPIGIMGNDGVFYAKAGWQRICLQYHKNHPVTSLWCQESDNFIAGNMKGLETTECKCLNGLTDIAAPLIVEGEHIATIFLGQFIYEDEDIEIEHFVNQAKLFGFDEKDYIDAFKEVPRFTREKVNSILDYYKGLLQSFIESGKLRTELNKALDASRFQEAKLQTLLNSVDDLIFINDEDFRFTEYISAKSDDLYVPVEEFIGKRLQEVLPDHVGRQFIDCYNALDRGITPEPVEYSLTMNGKECWFSARVTKIKGLSEYGYDYMTVVRDITSIKEHEQLIRKMAYYDELTGLYNRAMFYEFLNRTLEENKRTESECAVIFVDLDNFKRINDTRGHHVGDQLLKIIGQRLYENLRNADIISRIGGDEFTLIINEFESKMKVVEFLRRLIKLFNEPVVIDAVSLYITPSIGVSFYPHDGETVDELLKNADAAMYRAKESGRNRYQLYNEDINSHLSHKFKLENDLREALVTKEGLQVYYQPVVSPSTHSIRGVEALIRWFNNGEFVSPYEFIPIAEEAGLITPLGFYVFEESCKFAARMEVEYGQRKIVSVNTSIEQLKYPDYVMEIRKIVDRTGVSPNLIEIEITESSMIEEVDKMVAVLTAIKEIGIQIALDDFGTGYSSLGYIKSLPLDTVKIDRLFIKDICVNEVDRHILEVIVSLADKLNLEVISEGVEDKEQVDLLSHGLTDYIQGYYYYKPMPLEEVIKLLVSD